MAVLAVRGRGGVSAAIRAPMITLSEAADVKNTMLRILDMDMPDRDKAEAVAFYNAELSEETLLAVWSLLDSKVRHRWKEYVGQIQHERKP